LLPIDRLALNDDAPKENPWRDDRLGFMPFAERLSKVILNLRAPNGYVIGLHGEWGSGKSTAINFVKAFLDKHNQELETDAERIHVIDFRPWIVSGHQDLIGAFFKILSEDLENKKGRWWRKKLRPVLRWFKSTADPLVDAVATVAIVVDPSGLGIKVAKTVTKSSIGGMINRFLAEPSLQAAYENLKRALGASRKKFLVTIDDLDRLETSEIRSIMQMVKTVGQLPNVIYLLAYDREIVWGALDEGIMRDRDAPNFGEKIVQQEIELPRPAKEDLLAILDTEVAFVTDPSPSDTRWHYLVRDGLRQWMRHPRDVNRLANAIRFSWPALEGEIDPQDLVIMEGLRLFEEHVFNWARWNRDWLFNEGRYLMTDEGTRQAGLKSLTDNVPAPKREQVLRVMASLFPGQHKLFGERFQEEPYHKLVKRRGIGYEAGYDAYFSLYPSPNEVPKSLIDAAMTKLDDQRFLVETYRELHREARPQWEANGRTAAPGTEVPLHGRCSGQAYSELAPRVIQSGRDHPRHRLGWRPRLSNLPFQRLHWSHYRGP
jgi:KAP family P-loop domain